MTNGWCASDRSVTAIKLRKPTPKTKNQNIRQLSFQRHKQRTHTQIELSSVHTLKTTFNMVQAAEPANSGS